MDSYDNFDLIGDENLMQDAFKFGELDADPCCCFSTREGDWDPFSASGSGTHTSTTNDASIWSEELLNSIVGAEMVLGSDITDQLDEREAQIGPNEDNSGSSKSVMVIEGDQYSILSKGYNQADIIRCHSENPGVEMVIGGESNVQTHEIEMKMGPEYNCENLGAEMVAKEEFVMETSDVEADSRCTLPEPGPLGDCSPETESIIDKIVDSSLMEMSDKTEEAEENITEEKLSECNSKNLRCKVVVGCDGNTLDERNFHVGPTTPNSVNVGVEMVIEGGRNNELGEGECNMGRTGKALKSQMVTEGGRNAQSNERESHVVCLVDFSESLLDETLVEKGIDDQPGLGNLQVGPAAASCGNLFGDAEPVTTGDINNQCDEGDCQAVPIRLPYMSENGSTELNKCIGTSESSHLIQGSTYEVHEVLQGERNTQQEEAATAVSHSEKCSEQSAPSELQKSVDEKNCTGSQLGLPSMETGGKEERMRSELCGRELSISPGFSPCEVSVVKVEPKCAFLGTGLLSSNLPAARLTKVSAPTISTDGLDNKLVTLLCVETAPCLNSTSISANMGGHLMKNITNTKEAEKRTTEEHDFADCRVHTPVELTTGGCSSSIELTEETSSEVASVEKHDENEEALNESVLIHSNCKVDTTVLSKNLELNLGQRIHRDDTSRFLAIDLACKNSAVAEAVPESPTDMGNTKGFHDPSDDATTAGGLHDPSDDATTTGGLQVIQPIQVNHVKSDSMELSTEEILVTFENSISVMHSSVTELECQSDSLSKVIKETAVAEAVPDTELHGPRDCMREPMDVLAVIQSVDVKAVEPLERRIDEEANVNDNISENSIMNDVMVEDTGPEPAPVKLLSKSEPHGDASSVDGTQETDNNRISSACCPQAIGKGDEETNDKDISGKAETSNDLTVKDMGPTPSPVNFSLEHHADACPIDPTLVQSDALEQDAEDGALSVNPLMEEITEENNDVNASTKCKLSVAVDYAGPRPSAVEISFEFNSATNSIHCTQIQPENEMEDGKFSGNLLSEKSTEGNYKSTLTMEDEELSFSPVTISPASDIDAGPIDHVLVISEGENKNAKVSDGHLDENSGEDKSSEASEIINDTKIEDLVKISSKTNDEVTPANLKPIQSDRVIDDGKRTGDLGVVQSSGSEGEYSGAMNQRSEAMIGSLVEGMRPECESPPINKQGGAQIGAVFTDCVPIQHDIAESPLHIEEEGSEATNRSDTLVIAIGEEMETRSKLISQEMVELVEAENKTAEVIGASLENSEASSAGKLYQNSEIGDDGSAPQLEDRLQCTLTESKDPKLGLLEFGNRKRTCSSSECSLPEENITGVALDDLSPNVELDIMKDPQAKFISPENFAREDENTFESPSACNLGTVMDDKTEDLKRRIGISGSNVPSPSTSEAVMLDQAVNNGTCVEKNAKLPDLNTPQSATTLSQESLTRAQKMQLRAQIFVYGSLMDGSLPMEAYMERSFKESERCLWEPIWHAYSEMVKNKSPLSSGSRLTKTATRTIQDDTHLFTPLLDWFPALSSNFQFSWHFSPQSGARKEPLQPIRVRFESEKPSRRKRSFVDEVRSPSQNYVCRNANLIAATTDTVTSDFVIQTLPVPVSPVLTYARQSKKEKVGVAQVEPSCKHGSIGQSRSTSENLTDKVVPGCNLEKESNIEPICSLDRERSVFPCAALPVFQPQSPSGYYQIAPQARSCVLLDQSSRQAKESSTRASKMLDQGSGLQETVTTDKSSSIDPQDEVATAVARVEAVRNAAAAARLASEAAKLASEAALQAKLLADEAMGLMDPNTGMDSSMFQASRELEMVTPAKVLKSKDKVHGSDTIVSAMREASRRRVKLASAASKRAENMDTILRAAEMAAEAVSQVGQVVMMGDPLPFSVADMVEAIGGVHLRAVQSREADVSRREVVVDMGLATHGGAVAQVDEALMRDTVPLSVGQRELAGTGEDISVENGGNVIKKGSHVEVTGEKEGLIGVWFGAIVLDFRDGMAHIRYTDLPSCKEEWVPLEREYGAAPMVRLAHPVTALKYDGNRKRRRENVSSYSWSVGDHVDAWLRDGWWECIIAQKHADEAKYTVHFPVRGESLVVGEWDLRPSFVWKEGSWVEWVRVKENSEFSKGDSPLEKRQRVSSAPHHAEIVMPKPNLYQSTKIPRPLQQYARDSTSLSSGANQKREESLSEPKRNGPKVCFGVPRPNKKTKYLEVAQVSKPRSANDPTLVPNSNRQEKRQNPPTRIPEPSKKIQVSSRLKGLEGNLTKARGKKPTSEPMTRKRAFSSTILGGQNGTSLKKGFLTAGSGTSNRAGKPEVANAEPNEPRRSCRKVKPTSKLLEGLQIDGLMSKTRAGSANGSISIKGPTH